MKRLFLTLLIIGTILSVSVPASAGRPEPIGEKISLWSDESISFPAGEPFHISHGHILDPTDGYPIGTYSFEVEVDGRPAVADFVLTEYLPASDYPLYRLWVYNFPDGMSGTHTFTGRWFAPCEAAVNEGRCEGPCPNPSAPVETRSSFVVVDFTQESPVSCVP
jgi:hypothetical protein